MERYPRVGDDVIDSDRLARGEEHHGTIKGVDRRDHTVRVHFMGGAVEFRGDQTVRIGGILHHINYLLDHPEVLKGGGEIIYYDFNALEDNWSSHDIVYEQDGEGAWLIGD